MTTAPSLHTVMTLSDCVTITRLREHGGATKPLPVEVVDSFRAHAQTLAGLGARTIICVTGKQRKKQYPVSFEVVLGDDKAGRNRLGILETLNMVASDIITLGEHQLGTSLNKQNFNPSMTGFLQVRRPLPRIANAPLPEATRK